MLLCELKKEVEPYRNTLVLDRCGELVRLVDVVDGKDDFYWIYDKKEGPYMSSCVIDWIPLKGFIPDDKYEGLVFIWNLNNKEPAI